MVIDIDSFIGEVHGDQKQGASYGYTRQLGYHPIAAVRADTGEVLHIRNRKGKANTQRGAQPIRRGAARPRPSRRAHRPDRDPSRQRL